MAQQNLTSSTINATELLIATEFSVGKGKLRDLVVDDVLCDVIVGNLSNFGKSTTGTLFATNGTVGTLTATSGTVGTLTATNGTVGTLTATNGTVGTLTATNGTVGTLTATSGTIGTLTSTNAVINNLKVLGVPAPNTVYDVFPGGGTPSGLFRSFGTIPDAIAAAVAAGDTGVGKQCIIRVHPSPVPYTGDLNGQIVLQPGVHLRGYPSSAASFDVLPVVQAEIVYVNSVLSSVITFDNRVSVNGLYLQTVNGKPVLRVSQSAANNSAAFINLGGCVIAAFAPVPEGAIVLGGKDNLVFVSSTLANTLGFGRVLTVKGRPEVNLNDCNLINTDEIVRCEGPVEAPPAPFLGRMYIKGCTFDNQFVAAYTGTKRAIVLTVPNSLYLTENQFYVTNIAPSGSPGTAIWIDPAVSEAKIVFQSTNNWATIVNTGPGSNVIDIPNTPNVRVYGDISCDPDGITSRTPGNYIPNVIAS